jgi:hypothetical protein
MEGAAIALLEQNILAMTVAKPVIRFSVSDKDGGQKRKNEIELYRHGADKRKGIRFRSAR